MLNIIAITVCAIMVLFQALIFKSQLRIAKVLLDYINITDQNLIEATTDDSLVQDTVDMITSYGFKPTIGPDNEGITYIGIALPNRIVNVIKLENMYFKKGTQKYEKRLAEIKAQVEEFFNNYKGDLK